MTGTYRQGPLLIDHVSNLKRSMWNVCKTEMLYIKHNHKLLLIESNYLPDGVRLTSIDVFLRTFIMAVKHCARQTIMILLYLQTLLFRAVGMRTQRPGLNCRFLAVGASRVPLRQAMSGSRYAPIWPTVWARRSVYRGYPGVSDPSH